MEVKIIYRVIRLDDDYGWSKPKDFDTEDEAIEQISQWYGEYQILKVYKGK